MKKLLSLLLSVTLVVGLSIPARAVEIAESEKPPHEGVSPMVVVSSLEELQSAVESAEDGDTIALGQTIYIYGETISTDKQITLVRANSFTKGSMIYINAGIIDGFSFKESVYQKTIISASPKKEKVTIQNCYFDGGGVGAGIVISGILPDENLTKIVECEFANCFGNSVSARGNNSNVEMLDCYVHDSYAMDASGAVQSSGNLELTGCTITANTSWANAGVMCSGGTLTISNCQIKDNIILSPDRGIAVDIFCQDTTWSMTDSEHEGADYYDIDTGNKIALPVAESTEAAKLIYLTDEEAKDYFAPPTSSDESDTLPGDGDDHPDPAPDDDSNTPNNDENDNDSLRDEEPSIPEAGEDEDEQIPGVVPPTEDGESGQQPEEPIPPTTGTDNDGDTSDNDQSDTELPEKPVEDDSNTGNDYTPSRPHKPIQRPSEPDTDIQQPEEEPPVPALVCGDAIIDTSRSVVLAGYGDGLLHEEDPLTRAQLATIVYRLLTDESISYYEKGQPLFDDVSADVWYSQAVTTIGHAGIVSGVGGGRYDPDGLVTWAQAITVLSRFVEPQECELKHITYTGWARPFIETAVSLGWIEDNHEFVPDALIKRGELVSLFNSVLELYR